MLNKFNITALKQYSQRFAQNICNNFYKNRTTANGQDLLNITYIQQVNLFVIKDLYENWKADAEAFKSPFFNFDDDGVRKAMQSFMNVVSQNISVKRDDLEPLLAEATENALVLLLNPEEFYTENLRNQPNFMLSATALEQMKKYNKVNNFIPQNLQTRFGDRSFVYVNQAIEWLGEALSLQKPDSIDEFVNKFSEVEPLDTTQILKPSVLIPEPKAEEINDDNSFFDNIAETDATKVEPVNEVVFVAEPKIEKPEAVSEQEMPESLNDSLRSEQTTLVDNFQNKPINDFSEIPLHQRFKFITQLFSGSPASLDAALRELNEAPNYAAAKELIQFKFASQNMWDMTSETVEELLDIVGRRFGA